MLSFSSLGSLTNITFDMNNVLRVINGSRSEHMNMECQIQSLKIPKSVEIIGEYSFISCKYLNNVLISSSIQYIGEKAFYKINLVELNFENNSRLKIIADEAFYECNIQSIIILSSVEIIKEKAFYHCNIKTLSFETNSCIEIISDYAFSENKIEFLHFPKSLKSLGNFSFQNCESLNIIEFPNESQLNFIGEGCFKNSNTRTISFPSSIQCIDDYAFMNCKNLTSIHFPSNSHIMYIGFKAFFPSAIELINIPKTIIKVPFESFDKISLITLLVNNETCVLVEDEIFNNSQYILYNFTNNGASDIILNNTIKIIASFAFKDQVLNSVTIPSSVEKLENNSFYSSKIQNIIFEKNSNLRYIGHYAFYESLITSISIPDGVTFLGEHCFEYCMYLKSITIPQSILLIPSYFAYGCKNLDKITFANNSLVNIIGSYAFARNSKLEFIDIPNSLYELQDGVFQYCELLETINVGIDSKLQIINENVFLKTNISNFFIPKKVKKISSITLSNVRYVTINPRNEYFIIYENALYSKDGKSLIFYPKNLTKPPVFHPNTSEILPFAFYRTSIISIEIPGKIVSLWEGTFHDSKLKEVTFQYPSYLGFIYEGCFRGCDLDVLYLPENLVKMIQVFIRAKKVIFAHGCKLYSQSYGLDEVPQIYFRGMINSLTLYILEPRIEQQVYFQGSSINVINIQIPEASFQRVTINLFFSEKFTFLTHEKIISMKMPVNLSYLDYDNLYMLPNYLITNKNETVVYDYFGCESNIDLMDSVNEIYNSAFENNSYIESVSIPSSVRTIGSHAFKNCSNLKTIIISNQSNLEVIQYNAFKDCKCIDFIQNFTSDKYYAVNNTIIERSDISTVLYHAPLSPEESISISYDVIGSYSFEYSINIIQITIEDSVSRINEYAFHWCNRLEFIIIQKQDLEIENYTLLNCNSLNCIQPFYDSEEFVRKINNAGFIKMDIFYCIPRGSAKTLTKETISKAATPFLYSVVAS